MSLIPPFLATGIGSMPYVDPEQALDIVFKSLPDAPIWPQLPRRSLNEQMEIQYSEGMPRAVIDATRRRLYFDTSGDPSDELAAFYERYVTAMDPDEGDGDCSALALSPEYASGLYALARRLKARNERLPFLKVHTTGPVSFCLTVVDENKRALFYNESFRDMAVKALAMKCRWQIQQFAAHAGRVICFIDEPILSAFGSSTYVSVTRDDVVAMIAELTDAIHADGGIAGVHCCGNTEWSILVDAGVDIVNFDAFEYGETIAMYPEAVNTLFARGGSLAWGLVPSSVKVRERDAASLAAHFATLADGLVAVGVDRQTLLTHSLVTSSCGTGSLEPEDAERIFRLAGELSGLLRREYGFSAQG